MPNETGITPDQKELNEVGKSAVNAYLTSIAKAIFVLNASALIAIATTAYYSIQSMKAQAELDVSAAIQNAEDQAVRAAIARVEEQEGLRGIAMENLSSNLTAAKSLGELSGRVAALTDHVNYVREDFEKELLRTQNVREEIRALESQLKKVKEEDGYIAVITAIDNLRGEGDGEAVTSTILRIGDDLSLLEDVPEKLESVKTKANKALELANRISKTVPDGKHIQFADGYGIAFDDRKEEGRIRINVGDHYYELLNHSILLRNKDSSSVGRLRPDPRDL